MGAPACCRGAAVLIAHGSVSACATAGEICSRRGVQSPWPGRLTADRQLPRVGWLHPKRMTCGYDPAGMLALIGQTA